MENKLHALLEQIQQLEKEVASEIQGKGKAFLYEIKNKKVIFSAPVRQAHRREVKHVLRYLYDARFLHIVSAPVIWACLPPAVLMDWVATAYQFICFPIYGIPKVDRAAYIRIDRHFLGYLNIIEKINCLYCSYFNGLVAYWQEMAARTEQYWCPIKHAVMPKVVHSRYKYFVDYGDSAHLRDRWEKLRKSYDDLTAANN
jgi:hypothetical protein